MSRKIVVIGGGNGGSSVLRALRGMGDLTAIVTMADSGGSTGILRQELGVSAAGDVRQCLMALSEDDSLKKLFGYRFDAGFLDGHNFGNIFLAGAEKTTDGFLSAIELAAKTLQVQGRVRAGHRSVQRAARARRARRAQR